MLRYGLYSLAVYFVVTLLAFPLSKFKETPVTLSLMCLVLMLAILVANFLAARMFVRTKKRLPASGERNCYSLFVTFAVLIVFPLFGGALKFMPAALPIISFMMLGSVFFPDRPYMPSIISFFISFFIFYWLLVRWLFSRFVARELKKIVEDKS
jgi:hypothetical protein